MAELTAADGDRPNLPSLRSVSVSSSSSLMDVATSFRKMSQDEAGYNDPYGVDNVMSRLAWEDEGKDEAELQWAAIERLPTYRRIRTSLLVGNGKEGRKRTAVVDVSKMDHVERQMFIDNLLEKVEEDNLKLLRKLKERIDRVGIVLPAVEVRYEDLCIEAECEIVHGKPIPSLWNTFKSTLLAPAYRAACTNQVGKIRILNNVRGVLKPGRMTLLLGPPGCGKTTLLKALAGKTDSSLKGTGEITYNGYKLDEFVPEKTAAYISQYDLHICELTVRETLDFSARCQGVGKREDIIRELSRREKQAGLTPDPIIDTYMKAVSIQGQTRTLQTDYILKILGLDTCADTIAGDAMIRGISGGQKRRLTTGEMIVGPARVLLMDGISTGLDTSTTFQIITCLQQLAHLTESTIMVSLLQPAPETFNLFDDVLLMAEGQVVYHGPRMSILDFFEHCGFKCPTRKGVGDFLQEVVSRKDQAQYWSRGDIPHAFVSADIFAKSFREFSVGISLDKELSKPFPKTELHKAALTLSIYSSRKWELFKACLAREWLLMKRNSFLYVFKSAQLVAVAVIMMTVFLRTTMAVDAVHANFYMGALFYALVRLMCNGIPELVLTASRLGVFYKQRDFYFYPAWAYTIPSAILKIPISLLDSVLWTGLTYYVVGFSPEPQRFFAQLFLLFLVHQVSISLFRLIASVVRNPSVAATSGLFSLLVMFMFGGFLIPRSSLPGWLSWAFWLSPLSYAEIGASLNEFHAPRWQKVSSSNVTLGEEFLTKRGLSFGDQFYWVSVGALIGFWVIINGGFTCALTFSSSPQRSRTIISNGRSMHAIAEQNSKTSSSQEDTGYNNAATKPETIGMVLPFEPVSLTFEKVQYFVKAPKKLKDQGYSEERLQLLHEITGSFRPGVLTALMGTSGAGKTTLMDVLSGRKTSGVIEGEIKVGGFPKVQDTYARISAYCEQTDIHSPQVTIGESVAYSAWLRLPTEIDKKTRADFVDQVIKIIELDDIQDSIVGIPGRGGISLEQRKRLTIAVELVSNPSIIFMDEPTSGLDARAAAIVMRVVKNIVTTGRTIVCTIHQPSIDIFEAFDELILMKRGGRMIYCGEVGKHSSKLIEYFENIPGVPKIQENYNPATWMLEVTNSSMEIQLGVDFNDLYRESLLCKRNAQLVKELNSPEIATKELRFSSKYPQNKWEQFKACLWKQNLTYWRSPTYNFSRLAFITGSSLLCALLLWGKGQNANSQQDLLNILGAMFIFVQLTGIGNCSAVLPFIAMERNVVYRERFAGMYSLLSYASAQLLIEIPYILIEAILFTVITYPAIGFYISTYKLFWYLYSMFCTLLYFNYFGMMLVSVSPTYQAASVWASFSYTMLSLFSGYLIPEPRIPIWWRWGYWICPTAWSLKGILASQYGDIETVITVNGGSTTISEFLRSYLGYHYDGLGAVAVVLMAFPLAYACIFAIAIMKLNFQNR
ncbi:hypothetical protein MLD38_019921 [Melastoma candidum]|uniref:Uncharacterized protein n=1 Tax=Melastoma candidum TaxID=119954 RepID=A0ACB9QBK6_9MYRT|nr:hypothetical protein MLD38_019921 [Melastoma candidum]